MIYSMTAFARKETQTVVGHFICEMRSVNHRYLEISVHMPEMLRALEMMVRDKIKQTIKRGKVECLWRYQPAVGNEQDVFNINMHLARELCKAATQVTSFLKNPAPICPTEIMRFHGVLEMKEIDMTLAQSFVTQLLEGTLNELMIARNREGEELKQLVFQRTNNILMELEKVKERLPSILTEQNERINKRFLDAKVELDPQRLEQEMVIFTNRIDVSEEIDRATMHINEICRVLNAGGMMGRRLDFLLQELNREANTLGSKVTDSHLTHAAVEVKVLTEQIREQIQNIE